MYILVIGNPMDGFKYEGLFVKKEDATEYGERLHAHTEWWIATLVLNADKHETELVGAEPAPITFSCTCGHRWDQHTQNVHGIWVCTKCNCRMNRNDQAINPDGTNYDP